MRSLSLRCSYALNEAQPCAWEVAACLAACAATAAGSLQQLSLDFFCDGNTTLCVTSWCDALRQLRQLNLSGNVNGTVRIESSLAALTALTQLVLHGKEISLDAAAQLPPNVEYLRLCERSSTALPHQVCCACGEMQRRVHLECSSDLRAPHLVATMLGHWAWVSGLLLRQRNAPCPTCRSCRASPASACW